MCWICSEGGSSEFYTSRCSAPFRNWICSASSGRSRETPRAWSSATALAVLSAPKSDADCLGLDVSYPSFDSIHSQGRRTFRGIDFHPGVHAVWYRHVSPHGYPHKTVDERRITHHRDAGRQSAVASSVLGERWTAHESGRRHSQFHSRCCPSEQSADVYGA